MKKCVGKGDKKKKDKTMGTFPLSEILSGKRTKMRPKKKKDKTVGTFLLSEILSGKKDKNFGETYSVVLKTSLYVSKNVTICFHKIFLDY